MKYVSVVVPCYNASAFLDKCMEHLTKQTIGIENIEIILVDDASTDEGATWELIMQYEKAFSDTVIAIQLEKNMRQGGARNAGISYAGGEYLMFCDADDRLAFEAMEHLYDRAKKYDADVVQFRHKDFKKDEGYSLVSVQEGKESCLLEVNTEEERKAFLLKNEYTLVNNCWKKFYRMSMIQDNHIQFAEHLIFEEPCFTVPVLFYEKRHYFLDEELYFYYISTGSTTRSGWDQHRVDNIQVWLLLAQDLEKREFLQRYYDEIAYLFFRWGYAYNISLIMKAGLFFTVDEVRLLVRETLQIFPDIWENPYLKERGALDEMLLTVLNMEITDESVLVIHQVLRKYYL